MATIQLPTLLGTGNKWQQQVKWPLYFLRPLVSVVSLGATQTEMITAQHTSTTTKHPNRYQQLQEFPSITSSMYYPATMLLKLSVQMETGFGFGFGFLARTWKIKLSNAFISSYLWNFGDSSCKDFNSPVLLQIHHSASDLRSLGKKLRTLLTIYLLRPSGPTYWF